MLLALGLHLVLLLVGQSGIEIDLGKFADQVREDERIGVVGVEKCAALLGEIGFMRFLIHREEEFFLERKKLFLAGVLVKGELGFVDRLPLFWVLHHAEELFVARLAE